MPVEGTDVAYGNIVAEQPAPLVQTATRCGRGVLRIKGQQDYFLALRSLKVRDSFAGKGMPVAHSQEAARIQTAIHELGFEGARLALGKAADGRASADSGVVVLHFTGASSRNEFSQRFAADAGKGEVNNIGVAEKVIKERLDRSQGIRTAQLKQNHPHTPCCARHPLRFPRTGEFTPICGESQW